MLSIVLVSVALGLSNFAASVAIGLSGVSHRLRREIVVTFGFFEVLMPLVGLVLGRRLAQWIGSSASLFAGGLLVLTGVYTYLHARRDAPSTPPPTPRRGGLIVTGAALSVDNLVVGTALGAHRVTVVLAAVVIGVVSVAMSLLGLEVGSRVGSALERWSGELGAVILVGVGLAIVFSAS